MILLWWVPGFFVLRQWRKRVLPLIGVPNFGEIPVRSGMKGFVDGFVGVPITFMVLLTVWPALLRRNGWVTQYLLARPYLLRIPAWTVLDF